MRRKRGDGRLEDGAAMIAALALLAAIMAAALVALAAGQQAMARAQLSAAADVAALAAAQALTDACGAAAASAEANGVSLVGCVLADADVTVTVRRPATPLTVRLLGWLGHEARDLTAIARAGPSA